MIYDARAGTFADGQGVEWRVHQGED